MADVSVERAAAPAAAPAVANPAPLGLSAFAMTTFVLSVVNAGLVHAQVASVVIGLAFFYGGLCQLFVGFWEYRNGNTFGATAFTSYGAFWISFASLITPIFGGSSAVALLLGSKGAVLGDAGAGIGLYLLGWTIFTGIMTIGTLKLNGALIAVFGFLSLTFLSLTIGFLTDTATALNDTGTFITIGGWLGIITAVLAWYTAAAGVLASVNSPLRLPVFPMS
jgi:succinate-acetate transporter protein